MELNFEGLVYDAVYIVIFLCCVIFAANRGAFKAVAGIAGTVLGAVCGSMFNGPMAAWLSGLMQPLAMKLVGSDTVASLASRIQKLGMPEELQGLLDQALSAAGGAEEAARAALAERVALFLSEKVAPLLAFLLIFLVVKLAVSLVCSLLSLDIPILSTLNEWVGALIGAASGLIILLVLTWAVWRFAPDLGLPVLSREALQGSRIGGFFCKLFI